MPDTTIYIHTTNAAMHGHNETITRLKNEGKSHQADVENLLILLDVYDTLPPRPNGIQEGENWNALDPMMPLGQPVGKRFAGVNYAGYIVAYDYVSEGGHYLVRYKDDGLISFPARELDAYRKYYDSMQNRAPPPERAQKQGNVLFAAFNPVPNTYADTVAQAGGCDFLAQLSRENCLFELRDNRLPTSVPARNAHRLFVNTTKMVPFVRNDCPRQMETSLDNSFGPGSQASDKKGAESLNSTPALREGECVICP